MHAELRTRAGRNQVQCRSAIMAMLNPYECMDLSLHKRRSGRPSRAHFHTGRLFPSSDLVIRICVLCTRIREPNCNRLDTGLIRLAIRMDISPVGKILHFFLAWMALGSFDVPRNV